MTAVAVGYRSATKSPLGATDSGWHREIQDGDLGGHFTLKRYHSAKAQNPDGTWEHTRIVLSPDTTADGYEPIVIEASGDEEVRMIAEWLGVVG